MRGREGEGVQGKVVALEDDGRIVGVLGEVELLRLLQRRDQIVHARLRTG